MSKNSNITTSPASGDGYFKQNCEILNEISHKYPGEWLAAEQGKFIGHNISRQELLSELKEAGTNLKNVLLVKTLF